MQIPPTLARAAAGVAILAAALSAATGAHAQAGNRQQARQQLEQRFAAADADHDGKLTKAEAQAGMPRLAAHFDEIDSAHAGAVTLRQIERWLMARKRQGGGGAQPADD